MDNTFIIEPNTDIHDVIQNAKISFQTIRAYEKEPELPVQYVHVLRDTNNDILNIVKSIFGKVIVEYYSKNSILNLYTRIAMRADAIHIVILPFNEAAELLSVEQDISKPPLSYLIKG